jgi:hypothetical protein
MPAVVVAYISCSVSRTWDSILLLHELPPG